MSDVRAKAVKVIESVRNGRSLTTALEMARGKVKDRDQALLAELCYGVCRWYYPLKALVGMLVKTPIKASRREIETLLMLGLYQLRHMRLPDHAVVSETVSALDPLKQSWAKAFVNAVLRSYLREKEQIEQELVKVALVPNWLDKAINDQWPEHYHDIIDAYQSYPSMTLRVNLHRKSREDTLALFDREGISARPHPTVKSAIQLDKPVDVRKLPGFFSGSVSIQDAGAQLAAPLLAPPPASKVLDACAAPGGKTGHLLELSAEIDLIGVDVDEHRIRLINENLQRLGLSARLLIADLSRPLFKDLAFDRILLDVPCSATGVIRRHPDIRLLRWEEDVAPLTAHQYRLLEQLWPALKTGGRLLYVTCSVLSQENWQQMKVFINTHRDVREIKLHHDSAIEMPFGIQILPGRDRMDGFYYCLLEKY